MERLVSGDTSDQVVWAQPVVPVNHVVDLSGLRNLIQLNQKCSTSFLHLKTSTASSWIHVIASHHTQLSNTPQGPWI
jgi:hypothetical protein